MRTMGASHFCLNPRGAHVSDIPNDSTSSVASRIVHRIAHQRSAIFSRCRQSSPYLLCDGSGALFSLLTSRRCVACSLHSAKVMPCQKQKRRKRRSLSARRFRLQENHSLTIGLVSNARLLFCLAFLALGCMPLIEGFHLRVSCHHHLTPLPRACGGPCGSVRCAPPPVSSGDSPWRAPPWRASRS